MYNKSTVNLSLDHLEILFSYMPVRKESGFVFKINESNTSNAFYNYKTEDGVLFEFKYSIVTPKNYDKWVTFTFVYKNKPIDAFNIAFWSKTWAIKTSNKITFYSSFIYIMWKENLYSFIENVFNVNSFIWIRRFDIAVDIPENKKNLIESFTKVPNTTINFNKEHNEYETYYFWDRKNRTILVRIYDKVIDTFKKKKEFLYDYLETDNITRVELEFWKNEIDSFNETYPDMINYRNLLLDTKLLSDLFYSNIQKHLTYFQSKEYQKYDFTYLRNKKDEDELKDYYLKYNQLPKWYRQNWLWILKRLIDSLWFEALYGLLFETFDEKKENLEKFITYYYKHIANKIKHNVSRKNHYTPEQNLELHNEKEQLLQDICELIFIKNPIKSQDNLDEIQKTINKINGKINY